MPLLPVPDRPCLLLDVDGTLIDIAPRPEAVVVPPTLLADLRRAWKALGGAVALVSGRSIAQLDTLFTPLALPASGVHGAEIRFEPGESVMRSAEDAIPARVTREVEAIVAHHPGAFVENKVFSLAVHYRAVPDAGSPITESLAALLRGEDAAGLQMMPGHFVVELKRPTFDKGAAVRRFMGHPRFAGRTPVFIGDDVTDHPGFAAAVAAGGAAYAVGRAIPGTTGTFDSPSDVRAWVGAVADKETMPA